MCSQIENSSRRAVLPKVWPMTSWGTCRRPGLQACSRPTGSIIFLKDSSVPAAGAGRHQEWPLEQRTAATRTKVRGVAIFPGAACKSSIASRTGED